MNRENLERYYHSLLPFKKMLNEGEISKDEYDKIEGFLAKKNCIKNSNLYRANDLINNAFRVMYVIPKQEVITDDCN